MKHIAARTARRAPVSHDPQMMKEILLEAGELAPLTQLARVSLQPGQHTRPHRHPDMHEIFLVESGQGQAEIDGNTLSLAAGDCLWVEPGEEHRLSNPHDHPLRLFYFGLAAGNGGN
ncbi:cupin domain-containing protein [Thiohalobacter sp. IOR34]|uniref:cupin domain-containing protein n=1 Tax=Thiohalobacter sp. IOR34 TaxID=3057176 RepID=UPI0025AF761F|nr:cupin domain-containing protein [Thiohalobacter sp. IOR34]WJW76571.1 cupin domain-containing protein [Thiohalobacter sp. IOR34]